MAALRGVINHDPLDPIMESGNDGTLTADGEQAFTYIYEVSANKLPPGIQDMGIDNIAIESHSSKIYDGSAWPERVAIKLHEAAGLTKLLQFVNDSGVITALDVAIYDDGEAYVEVGKGLSDDQKDEIIKDMISGRTHWLEQDGPAGEYAQAVAFNLTFTEGRPSVADVDLLSKILAEFNDGTAMRDSSPEQQG